MRSLKRRSGLRTRSIQVSTYRSRADFRTRLLVASRSRADFRTCLLLASRSRLSTTLRALSLPGCIPGLDRTFALAQVSTPGPQHFALAARSLPSRSREQRNEHVCTSAAAEHARSVRRIDVNKQNPWWQKNNNNNPGRRKKETRKKEGRRKKKR
jgi:hypothetical protein